MKRTPKKKEKESDIQRSILDYLAWKGYLAVKFSSVGIYNKKTEAYIPQRQRGVSDILAVQPVTGRFIAIECKTGSNAPSHEQAEFLENVKKKGGMAIVAYSLGDVMRGLEEHD